MSSTLEEITSERRGLVGMVSRISERFGGVSRRGFLVSAAVAGSALATDAKAYALRPQTAYATICGPGNTASSGWTVFCSTINKGVNSCPPGSFAAGWWKAADSSWCGRGYRYIVDCNASCSKCSTGCSGDHICDKGCWNCSCGTGSTATCDQRRICCNAFRYGQCNTHVKCSGGVHCRVVSCVPPYKWTNCTTTSLRDDRTSEHSAPSLPKWGPIAAKYKAMGEQGSFLRASTGPVRSVGDSKGTYVRYQGGAIYSTSATGARSVANWQLSKWNEEGGPKGKLGYPTSDRIGGRPDGGWIQTFQKGALTDSASTSTQCVWGMRWTVWQKEGRESGRLGYPTGPVTYTKDGWIQRFQKGAITDSNSTTTQSVWGIRYDVWAREGRESGRLGYPTGPRTDLGNSAWQQKFQKGVIIDSTATTTQVVYGASYSKWSSLKAHSGPLGFPTAARTSAAGGGWIQLFQRGAVCDSTSTFTNAVYGAMYTAWAKAGREGGRLGYPTSAQVSDSRGTHQKFQGGELWALGSGTPRMVHGSVLEQWKAAGGASGSYGYPLTDTVESGGRTTCQFEGGTISA